MSDAIVRLRVESQEYDAKLKRAAEGLQRYADECRKVGGTLEVVEKDTLEYIKAIGKMETVNKSAQGSIEEMTRAYQEFARIYKQMSDEEKASPTGKILSQSLGELKTRIIDSKQELADINRELGVTSKTGGETNSIISSLTSTFGISTKQIAGFGAAIGATKMALDVAKDAFFATQSGIDEWGRIVKETESIYDSFLISLNNSDISGFLSRIDDITTAAREAYNVMSDLEVYGAFNQRNSAKSKAAYQKALDEYKLNPTAQNKEALAKANQQVLAELQQSRDRSERAYQTELRNVANKLSKDQSIQNQFIEILSSGNIDKLEGLKGGYKTGSGLNAGAQYYFGNRVYDGRIQDRATGKWSTMSKEDRADFNLARALSQITTEELKKLQGLGAQSVGYEEQMYRQDRMYNRMAGNNPSVTKTTPTSITIDLSKIGFDTNKAALSAEHGVDTMPSLWEMFSKEYAAGYDENGRGRVAQGDNALRQMLGIGAQQWDYNKDITEKDYKKLPGFKEDKEEEKLTKELKNVSGTISGLAGGLNSITSGIKAIGFDLPDEIDGMINGLTGLAQIISGVGTIIELFGTTSEAANTVAVNANTVAIGGLITALEMNTGTNLIPFFARGGIVPHAQNGLNVVGGTHYSGDVTPILANAGEVVLNHAQVQTLASNLQGVGMQNLKIQGVVTGQQLRLVLVNTNRQDGGAGLNIAMG